MQSIGRRAVQRICTVERSTPCLSRRTSIRGASLGKATLFSPVDVNQDALFDDASCRFKKECIFSMGECAMSQ
eukprot:11196339-Lingulodinium_polyedra.AAC.1